MPEIARYPSLHTRWLQRTWKDMPQCLVVFSEEPAFSGCYYHPRKVERRIKDRFIPSDCGVIVISTDHTAQFSESDYTAVIAHEWRHHWQMMQGWVYDGIRWNNCSGNYKRRVRQYYRSSRSEWDALRFEHRKIPQADFADHCYSLAIK